MEEPTPAPKPEKECLRTVSTCGRDPRRDWVPRAALYTPRALGWSQDARFQPWLCR